jgi:hypothetical protein
LLSTDLCFLPSTVLLGRAEDPTIYGLRVVAVSLLDARKRFLSVSDPESEAIDRLQARQVQLLQTVDAGEPGGFSHALASRSMRLVTSLYLPLEDWEDVVASYLRSRAFEGSTPEAQGLWAIVAILKSGGPLGLTPSQFEELVELAETSPNIEAILARPGVLQDTAGMSHDHTTATTREELLAQLRQVR